jgi:hypothetical protein
MSPFNFKECKLNILTLILSWTREFLSFSPLRLKGKGAHFYLLIGVKVLFSMLKLFHVPSVIAKKWRSNRTCINWA